MKKLKSWVSDRTTKKPKQTKHNRNKGEDGEPKHNRNKDDDEGNSNVAKPSPSPSPREYRTFDRDEEKVNGDGEVSSALVVFTTSEETHLSISDREDSVNSSDFGSVHTSDDMHVIHSIEECNLCIASKPACTEVVEYSESSTCNEIVSVDLITSVDRTYSNIISVQDRKAIQQTVLDDIKIMYPPFYDFCVISSDYDYERAEEFKILLCRAFSLTGCMLNDGFLRLGADLFDCYESMIDHSTKVFFFLTDNFNADNFCRRIQSGAIFQALMSRAKKQREKCVPVLPNGYCHVPLALSGIAGLVPRNHDILLQSISTTYTEPVRELRKLHNQRNSEKRGITYAQMFHKQVEARKQQLSLIQSNISQLSSLQSSMCQQNMVYGLGGSMSQLNLLQGNMLQSDNPQQNLIQGCYPGLPQCNVFQPGIEQNQFQVGVSQLNIVQGGLLQPNAFQGGLLQPNAFQGGLLQPNAFQGGVPQQNMVKCSTSQECLLPESSLPQTMLQRSTSFQSLNQSSSIYQQSPSLGSSLQQNLSDVGQHSMTPGDKLQDSVPQNSGLRSGTPRTNSPFDSLPVPEDVRKTLKENVPVVDDPVGASSQKISIKRSSRVHIGHHITVNIYGHQSQGDGGNSSVKSSSSDIETYSSESADDGHKSASGSDTSREEEHDQDESDYEERM